MSEPRKELMRVNWVTKQKGSPIIFDRKGVWDGAEILHRKALAGEVAEYSQPSHELNITLSGHIETRKQSPVGRMTSNCGPIGSVCVVPASQPHSILWGDDIECVTIHLEPSLLQQTAIENEFSPRFELIDGPSEHQDRLVSQLGLALVNEANSEGSGEKMYSESLLQTLILHVLKNYSTARYASGNLKGGLSGYKLKLVTEYINDNLDKELSLAELSRIADLSQYHFSRSFRETTGLPPRKFLMKRRVEKAKMLLAESDLPIVEVGFQTGFKTQSHFTSLFRRLTDVTPRVWRQLMQN
ncbi:MAG: helix-turn-helix transcriptional regulator [Pyrinomonadaceae bacterium]|nr:helix-turn-helix transcriptional regulator [Pyrinomonadaceae bacterium]